MNIVERLRDAASDTEAVENASVARLLDEAAAEIERLRAGWILVSDRLPETRTNVMAYDGNFPHSMTSFRIVSLTIDCQQWYDAHSDQEFEVAAFTHWMPLPEPPEVT